MTECDAWYDSLCKCNPENNDFCHYNEEVAALQKLQEDTKQALNDIGRDELDHDNVHVIVRAMLKAGYQKDSALRKAVDEHNKECARLCELERKCKTSVCGEYRNNKCPDCPRDWMISD